jgi:integrase
MKHSIVTKTARSKLKPRREPYWHRVAQRKHLGYRRTFDGGTWIARILDDTGKRAFHSLGDGIDFDTAQQQAVQWFETAEVTESRHYRVKDAIDDYVEHLSLNNSERTATDTRQRMDKHLPKPLLSAELASLTTLQIKSWHKRLVSDSDDPETVRRSKDTANKNLVTLKAAFNLAFRSGLVSADQQWRRVLPFRGVGQARKLFLTDEQVRGLLDHCSGAFHSMVKAAVFTGARYGELCNARVDDFNPKRGTVTLSGKTGTRECYLSDEAVDLFKRLAGDRTGNEYLLVKDDGTPWGKSHQHRPMKAVVAAAGLPPEAVLYSLRHYFISKALLSGVQPQLLAENVGTSLKMIEQHYGKFQATDRRAMFNLVALL